MKFFKNKIYFIVILFSLINVVFIKESGNFVYEDESDTEEIDLDEVTYFIEDIQNIALEHWKDITITNKEARRAINLWFSPEEYYEYRLNNWSIQE